MLHRLKCCPIGGKKTQRAVVRMYFIAKALIHHPMLYNNTDLHAKTTGTLLLNCN